MIPNSAQCPPNALVSMVDWRTSSSRVLCSVGTPWRSALHSTKLTVGRRAGFHAEEAGRKRPEDLQQLGAPPFFPDLNLANSSDAVDLKNRLGEIETDHGRVQGGRFLHLWPLQCGRGGVYRDCEAGGHLASPRS